MVVSVNVDVREFTRGLKRLEKKQMPFAISLALNATAQDVKVNAIERLSKDLDRPTPFTKRGQFIQRSTKVKPVVTIRFKDIQSGYLKFQQDGGTRRPKKRAIVVPVANKAGFRRNRYGNMTRGAVKRLLAKPNVFSGKVKGVGGIWERPKRGKQRRGGYGALTNVKAPKLLASYKSKVKYKSRMDYPGAAVKVINTKFRSNMAKSLARALATKH